MLPSIPASKIVNVLASVLGTGGTALALNTVVITDNSVYPIGQYSTAADVAAVWGYGSKEHTFALTYFAGYAGSTIKPSTLYFARNNITDASAKLIGATRKSMTLSELKAITGDLTVTIDGVAKTGAIDLTAATSFSDAASKMATALTLAVSFDTQLQSFIIESDTVGAGSSISFATGTASKALGLSKESGAQVDNVTEASTVDSVMERIAQYTLNFATITVVGDSFTIDNAKDFAEWNAKQLSRYWFVYYSQDPTALIANNAVSFGSWLEEQKIDGTTVIYGTLEHAALACGYAASLNFSETNGRATMEFKRQSGIEASVTNTAEATALESNGYAYYGAFATANDRFVFFRNTRVSGDFKWVDPYLNQVYFNSQLQLAFMTMLMNYKAIPYNAEGVAIHRAAAQDPIAEMINFGGIQAGIELSEQQKAQINYEAGFDAARQLENTGYCLLIQQVTAQNRGNRASLPIKLWYTDGGSVHSVNLASINVQ